MSEYFLRQEDLPRFLQSLMAAVPVVGPVAKKNHFVFQKLSSPEELRLDYDVSLLPPKKAIFPQTQRLLDFSPNGPKSCIAPREQVLFGVHFYDIKAIDMLDHLFSENVADQNYLANRRATTIVGSSIQKVSDRAFWGSVGKNTQPKGHDAFLTKISGGYHFKALTEKGKKLTSHGQFSKASDSQTQEAKQVNEEILGKCPQKLQHSAEQIAQKVRSSFKNEKLWDELADKCFSCGSCNIACSTCYCFDVQDKWNLDQKSGHRTRTWDACLTEDFAKVSLGAGGATENFREKRSHRFRHRVMRKTAYLNDKLGGPACVGCGRCSEGCVPDIADPVKIINKIMES